MFDASIELTIVVPAFNEAQRIPMHLPRLLDAVDSRTTQIIVVDDGSTDDTADVVLSLLGSRPAASLIRLPSNQGKGAAVRAGVARAEGAAIAYMDADLAADIRDLPLLVHALEQSHIAVGSRAVPGSETTGATLTRVCMGRTFNRMARVATGVAVRDFQCPLKAMRASTAKLLFHLSQVNGYAFDAEILALADRIGYQMVEVPIHFGAVAGSHIRPLRDPLRMTCDLVRIRTRSSSQRLVSAIEAYWQGAESNEAALALFRSYLPISPVVPLELGALVLLPFLDPVEAEELARSVQARLPGYLVRASIIPGRDLLAPEAKDFRAALTAS